VAAAPVVAGPVTTLPAGALALVVVAVLAACGPPAGRAPAPGPSSPSSTAPSPSSPSPSSLPPALATLAPIRYERSGGLAGVHDVLVIAADGTATLTSRRPALHRTGRLTAAELAGLTGAVPQGRVPEAVRRPRDPHPDGFVYTVTFATSNNRFTGAAVPPDLVPMVRALREISGRLGRAF
jgi:hypothetical protein